MHSNKCTVSRLQGFSPTPSPKILLVVNQKKTENIIQLNVAVLLIIMPTEKNAQYRVREVLSDLSS